MGGISDPAEIFPSASIYTSRKEPGYWDSISPSASGQLFFASRPVSWLMILKWRNWFLLWKTETMFLSVLKQFPGMLRKCCVVLFRIMMASLFLMMTREKLIFQDDSLQIGLLKPPFFRIKIYLSRRTYDSKFTEIDRNTSDELGITSNGEPNFIHLKAGSGNLYLHLAPLTFSNYFLLHKNNMEYFEKALSVIRPDVQRIVWMSILLLKEKPHAAKQEKLVNCSFPLSCTQSGFTYSAADTACVPPSGNAPEAAVHTFDEEAEKRFAWFCKTIGRLYYDRSDHKNLCLKMAAYFLEHIRSHYKLPTKTLDDQFIRNVQFKTGVDETEIRNIISSIRYAIDAPAVSAKEVVEFHKQLESFL